MNSEFTALVSYIKSNTSTLLYPKLEGNGQNEAAAPMELRYDDKFGRFLVASRDLEKGEVIFWEAPLVIAPKSGSGPTCLDCCRPVTDTDWSRCQCCGMPRCFPLCDGQMHSQDECDLIKHWGLDLQKNSNLIKQVNTLLTPLRAYLACQKDEFVKEVMENMQSNIDKRKLCGIGLLVQEFIVKFFIKHNLKLFDANFVQQVCGVFDTNAFEVRWNSKTKARALLPAAALMNHSCVPNTQHWFYEGHCVVRASTSIRKGQPLTSSYTHTLWGTKARLKHLQMTKFFTCTCKRCTDPTELGTNLSTIRCSQCEQLMFQMSNSMWKCVSCSESASHSHVDAVLQVASSVAENADTLDAFGLLKSINKLVTFLGSQHYALIQLQFIYVQLLSSNVSAHSIEELEYVYIMAKKLLKVVSKIEYDHSRLRGLLLLYTSTIFLELFSRSWNMVDGTKNEWCKKIEDTRSDICESLDILHYDPEVNSATKIYTHIENIRDKNIMKQAQ